MSNINPYIGSYVRKKIFLEALKYVAEKSLVDILDIGCGNGDYCFMLAKRHPSSKIIGIDLAIHSSIKINDNVNLLESDLFNYSIENKFNFIYSIDVIDDIKDWQSTIEKMNDLLKQGGFLFLHVPIHPRPISFIKNSRIDNYWDCDYKASISTINRDELINKLTQLDYQIIKSEVSFNPLIIFLQEIDLFLLLYRNTLSRLVRIILNPIMRAIISLRLLFLSKRGNYFYVLARKN